MTWSLSSTSTRVLIPVATVLSLLAVTTGPASAAKAPAHTTISAHLTAATVLAKSTATITGVVTPAGGTLAVEELVGKKYATVAHATPNKSGGYTVSVRAPKSASTWSLKVVRAASKTAKAGTSATLKLNVVTKQFVVAAVASTVTAPAATVVTGVVVPAASGTVQVQRLVGATWTAVASSRLSAGGAFSASVVLPIGADKLRVVKPFTSTVAQGTSVTVNGTVVAPTVVAPPTITSAALTTARVGVPYASVLTATGGTGFYTWAGTGLPAGLTLSPAGLLAGTPTAQGTASFTATVTDNAGHSASSSLSLTSAPATGRLFAVGTNYDGLLGIGVPTATLASTSTFVPVFGMDSVIAAAPGAYASLAVKADGSVWAWGDNTYGQLGTGTNTPSLVPLQVAGLAGVTAVAAGEYDGYALKSDGTVWGWGDNMYGEVGDGTMIRRLSPVQVSGLSSVVAINSTQNTVYALKSDGTVWAWGANDLGGVGDGTQDDRSLPVQVSGLTGIKAIGSSTHTGYAVRSDGTVAAWGADDGDQLGDGAAVSYALVPKTVPNVSGATQIVGGLGTAYALTASGGVVGWGYNSASELGGVGSSPSNAVALTTPPGALEVAAGFGSGYALMPDHTVVDWGRNDQGQLGNGGTSTATSPRPMVGVTNVISVLSSGFGDDAFLIAN